MNKDPRPSSQAGAPALVLLTALVVSLTGGVAAQPKDGDLIVAGLSMPSWRFVMSKVDRTSGTWSTLSTAYHFSIYSYSLLPAQFRMDENNRGLYVAETDLASASTTLDDRGRIGRIDATTGIRTQVTVFRGHGDVRLDHDGTWIAVGCDIDRGTPFPYTYRYELAGIRGSLSRPYHLQHARGSGSQYRQVLVDRDPGGPAYVVEGSGRLLRADRSGILGTISGSIAGWPSLFLDEPSGDYLLFGSPGSNAMLQLNKQGRTMRTLGLPVSAVGAALGQDGTAWVSANTLLARVDLRTGTTTTLLKLGPSLAGIMPGLVIYGSRRLVCTGSGVPGTSVQVRLQSRRPADAGQAYALACSAARRPGLRVAGGERLNLDVTDGLFLASAGNLAPAVFRRFHGVTDKNGEATASVAIPKGLPSNTGITVFVAGVIYDATGVRTVTNTHWFVLN